MEGVTNGVVSALPTPLVSAPTVSVETGSLTREGTSAAAPVGDYGEESPADAAGSVSTSPTTR